MRDLPAVRCMCIVRNLGLDVVNAKGGKWTDGGAAQQESQDIKAVIRPRRSRSYVQIDAQGEDLPLAAYEMKRSDALHCAECRTHL